MSNTNNLLSNAKATVPYTIQSITADDFIKTNNLIIKAGINIDGNSKNITIRPDLTVKPGTTGPILHIFGPGGENSSVGITLDTFSSPTNIFNGRLNGNNPATQIMAIDNGEHSSDLVFSTANPQNINYNLPRSEERMRIKADGDININKSLYIDGDSTVNSTLYCNGPIIGNSTLHVEGESILNGDVYIDSDVYIKGMISVNQLNINYVVLNFGSLGFLI